jgi:hypothetical protein
LKFDTNRVHDVDRKERHPTEQKYTCFDGHDKVEKERKVLVNVSGLNDEFGREASRADIRLATAQRQKDGQVKVGNGRIKFN